MNNALRRHREHVEKRLRNEHNSKSNRQQQKDHRFRWYQHPDTIDEPLEVQANHTMPLWGPIRITSTLKVCGRLIVY